MTQSVRFTPAERAALLGLLVSALRQPEECGVNLAPLQAAYGRILLGDKMTPAEAAERLPKGWEMSPSAAVPVLPRVYIDAQTKAIRAREEAVTGKHTAP